MGKNTKIAYILGYRTVVHSKLKKLKCKNAREYE